MLGDNFCKATTAIACMCWLWACTFRCYEMLKLVVSSFNVKGTTTKWVIGRSLACFQVMVWLIGRLSSCLENLWYDKIVLPSLLKRKDIGAERVKKFGRNTKSWVQTLVCPLGLIDLSQECDAVLSGFVGPLTEILMQFLVTTTQVAKVAINCNHMVKWLLFNCIGVSSMLSLYWLKESGSFLKFIATELK